MKWSIKGIYAWMLAHGKRMTKWAWDTMPVVSVIAAVASAIAAVSTACLGWRTYGMAKVEYAEVVELRESLERQRTKLGNTLDRVSLYGDIASAEGGDRFAYVRASEQLRDLERNGDHEAGTLLQKLLFSTRRFMGGITNNPSLEYTLSGFPSHVMNVEAMLKGDWFLQRLDALEYVRRLRLNKYFPDIVEMLKKEPDLNVVQLAIAFINETFADNIKPNDSRMFWLFSVDDCVFRFDDFHRHVSQMWDERKDEILARKPMEVRSRQDSPKVEQQYIFDPEKPEE